MGFPKDVKAKRDVVNAVGNLIRLTIRFFSGYKSSPQTHSFKEGHQTFPGYQRPENFPVCKVSALKPGNSYSNLEE